MFDGIMTTAFLLFFGHAMADYPFQNRFMAIGKNPNNKDPECNSECSRKWYHKMIAHCLIHGGMVMLVTGMWQLAYLEFALHFIIDINKCNKRINANVDQGLHILCKIMYVVILVLVGAYAKA